MKIRLRLALAYALALGVSIALVGLVIWWQQGIALRSALDARLAGELTDLVATIEEDGPGGIVEPDDKPDVVFVAVFDDAGRRLAAEPGTPDDLAAPLPQPGISQRPLAGGPVVLHVATAAGGTIAVAGADLAPVLEAQARLAESVVAVGAIAVLLSLVGGWWLAGRALAPVAELTAEAAAIGATDLGRRLPDPDRNDELGVLARTLNGMLDRIDAGVQRQRRFLAAASHDLRTPVAALQAELELADRPDADADELLAALRAARGDAVRLGDLAAGLLELVSAGVDGRALVRTDTELRDVVDSAVRHSTPPAADRGVLIRTDVADAIVSVDRVRIVQALRNVVANAVTYSPSDGVVEVTAGVHDDADAGCRMLTIETLDRGPGIPDAERSRVFEPFGRGSSARGPGSGLGLSTARAAVEAHGGVLRALPRTGGGTLLSMRIPLPGNH